MNKHRTIPFVSTSAKNQRGSMAILFALGAVTILGMGALAVDVGYIFWSQSRLQNAADAAALVATKRLPEAGDVQASATQFATKNYPNAGSVVHTNDVILGVYDSETGKFTPLSAGGLLEEPNAVRIHARRAQVNGNPLELFFSRVLGRDHAELSACALGKALLDANPGGIGCPGGAIVGLDKVWFPGTALVDSYSSAEGTYESQTPGENGNVASGGDIDINGSVEIFGDARPGPYGDLNTVGPVTITGSTDGLSSKPVAPVIDPGDAATNNNNWFLPGYAYRASTNAFKLTGNRTVTMPPGTYYFSSYKQVGNTQVVLNGRTVIYVEGEFDLGGNGMINADQSPLDVAVYVMGGETAHVRGTASFYGRLIAPKATVEVHGTPDFYGCLFGKVANIRGTAGIHYDIELKDVPPGSEVEIQSSELVGAPGC